MKRQTIKCVICGINILLFGVIIRLSEDYTEHLLDSGAFRFYNCTSGYGADDVRCLEEPHHTVQLPKPSDYNNTKLVVYNVIPKCGSTTVRNHMRHFQKINHFKAVTLSPTEEDFAEILISMSRKSDRPILFAYHHPFVDFARIGYPMPPHVQVMREPVQQAISVYHFYMTLRKMAPIEWNMTIEECFESLERCPCLKGVLNVTSLHHFCEGCGEYSGILEARHSTPGAVEKAKESIVKTHSVVGITEEMTGFFDVLEYMHPALFEGAAKAYRKRESTQGQTLNVSQYRKKWPDWAMEVLRKNLKDDIEIYKFVKSRFYVHWEESKNHKDHEFG